MFTSLETLWFYGYFSNKQQMDMISANTQLNRCFVLQNFRIAKNSENIIDIKIDINNKWYKYKMK